MTKLYLTVEPVREGVVPQLVDKLIETFPELDVYVAEVTGSDLNQSRFFDEGLKDAEILAGNLSKSMVLRALELGAPLKWVQAWSAGVNYLPLEELGARDIYVTSARGVHKNQLSEVVIGLLISFERQFPRFVRQQEQKVWARDTSPGEIHDKTIGIIGYGSIGEEVARVAKQGFGMTTWGLRKHPRESEWLDNVVGEDGIDELLENVDYLVNLLPATPDTVGYMDFEKFSKMKPSAFYVNIGRGATDNEADLIRALEEGVIAGAGLDVFAVEPLPEDHPFWTTKNLIVLPHQGGFSYKYDERAFGVLMDNLKGYLETGKPARNIIDLEAGY